MHFVSSSPPELTDGATIWVSRYDLSAGDHFGRHAHDQHQITWSSSGVLVVDVGERSWVLPPTLALFIPSQREHDVTGRRPVRLHNLYLEAGPCPIRWTEPTAIAITPLLSEVVAHLADPALLGPARCRAEGFLYDLLRPVASSPIDLRFPRDVRALDVANGLEACPADNRTLEEWGDAVGASARTLARRFVAETGLTFADWRAQARLHAALVLLAAGGSTDAVARQVGYRSTSAFVERFRTQFGVTPGALYPRGATGGTRPLRRSA